jgi:chromosome segregation ATPase
MVSEDLNKKFEIIKVKIDRSLDVDIKNENLDISATLKENFKFLLDYKKKIIESLPTYKNRSYEYWSKISDISIELKSRKMNLSTQQEELDLIQRRQYEMSQTKKVCAKNLKIQENELVQLQNAFIKNDRKIEYCENRISTSSKLKTEKISRFINVVFQNNNKDKITKIANKLAHNKKNSIDLAQKIDKKQNLITDAASAYADSRICLANLQQTDILLRQDIQTLLAAISENAKEISYVQLEIQKNTDNLKAVSSSLVEVIEQVTRVECSFQTEQKAINENFKSVPFDWMQENNSIVVNKSSPLEG